MHVRQRAAHGEMTDVDAARNDHEIDGVGGGRITGRRILGRKKAHDVLPDDARLASGAEADIS
jgi:hypothetical protein